MKNVWLKLAKKKPFFVLAPMAGVTDSPFRQIVARIGKSDLMFTEFVSTEQIARVKKIPIILKYTKKEKPLIAQFFGYKPEQFKKCAELALKLGFDGIDINMGCPDRKVLKQGSGSELIKNPDLAIKIIRTVKKVVDGKIPVSIKIRIGYERKDYSHILEVAKEEVTAITIHGRTVKQGYTGEADWEAIGEVAKKIKSKFPNIVVIGNGDVKSLEQGYKLAEKYGVDGVMIGRQVLKNPWIFSGKENINLKSRLENALKHTLIFEKFYGKDAGIGPMKKYYKAYLSGVPKDQILKKELMETKKFEEAKKILQ